MASWFRRLFGDRPGPLAGAPAAIRIKNYAAASGYAFEYYYKGWRPLVRGRRAGVEYVFHVASGRREFYPMSVFLPRDALRHWEREHGRGLIETERYAIAKLALFRVLDALERPTMRKPFESVDAVDVAAFLERLGID